MRACVAAVAAVAGLTVLLAVVRVATHRALDRRRMAQWDAEWLLLDTRWTGQR